MSKFFETWSMNGMLGFWPTLFFLVCSPKHNLVLKLNIVCEVNQDRPALRVSQKLFWLNISICFCLWTFESEELTCKRVWSSLSLFLPPRPHLSKLPVVKSSLKDRLPRTPISSPWSKKKKGGRLSHPDHDDHKHIHHQHDHLRGGAAC